MGSPYIGEIRIFAGNFAPFNWAFCDGALLAISQNDALFSLIGTTYGGDGVNNFNLPDLRGRLPMHQGTDRQGNSYTIGQQGGLEQVTLTVSQIPAHSHAVQASTSATSPPNVSSPGGNVWAQSDLGQFASPSSLINMSTNAIGSMGGSQPHDNMVPFLAVNFIISLFGIFPSQT